MILSQTAVYALKAVLHLAESDAGTPIRVDDIAKQLGVPRNYLSKILHVLARAGILSSTRGPGGGFHLSYTAEQLMLRDVIEHFDDVAGESAGCLLGQDRCSDTNPCAAHQRWKSVSIAVRGFFNETSIADFAKDASMIDGRMTDAQK